MIKDSLHFAQIKMFAASACLGLLIGCGGDDPQHFAGAINVANKPRTKPDFQSIAHEAKDARKAKRKFDVNSKTRAPAEVEAEPK
jgi:hypothetical protein